jgi:hypothetical protein
VTPVRLVAWYAAAQALDVVTTMVAIRWHGLTENNPVAAVIPFTVMAALKIIVAPLSMLGMLKWYKGPATVTAWRGAVVAVGFAWFIAGTNVLAIIGATVPLDCIGVVFGRAACEEAYP